MNNTFLKNIVTNDLDLDGVSLEVYLLRHVNQIQKYKAVRANLANNQNDNDEPDNLNDWLKQNIKQTLENYYIDNLFPITDYNIELNVNDVIASIELPMVLDESNLKLRYDKIIEAITESNNNESLDIANFQIIKLSHLEEDAFIGYYRGIQKSTKTKKKYIFNGNDLKGISKGVIDIGGKISFILIDNKIYIVNPLDFEYAFKYTDEINAKRDEALNKITELPCFNDQEVKALFLSKSKSHLYARGLAQMKEETFDDIEEYYNTRCAELIEIRDVIDNASDSDRQEIEKEYGILIDIMELIDLDNDYRIDITEESNITPLLHFFQDKIMESFLSKKIRTTRG